LERRDLSSKGEGRSYNAPSLQCPLCLKQMTEKVGKGRGGGGGGGGEISITLGKRVGKGNEEEEKK